MAVTQQEVDAAYNAREAARAKIDRAQAALTAARPYTPAFETAKAEVDAAKGEYSRAQSDYVRISNTYNKENPTKKPESENEIKVRNENAQRQRNKNDPSFGMEVTDKERYDIEQDAKPKPARTDSPVQVQTANTGAQNAAETGRHNRQTESQAASNAQREALVQAGTLANNTREQVSREAQTRTKAEQDNIAGTVGAATTLVDARTRMRGQDIEAQKTRSAFVQDVLTTAMPAVVQLMLKTPKGSPAAANFLKAFLTMASEAYRTAQLGNIPPPIDMNSPEMITLTRRAGYSMPDQLPSMPHSNQVDQQTVQSSAVMGHPLPGDQGAVGAARASYPEIPNSGGSGVPQTFSGGAAPTQSRNGAGIDPLAEAAQSPEGQSILQALKGQVADVEAKLKRGEPLTAEEQQKLSSARVSYNQQIREIAAKRQQQVAQRNPADDLKDEVRSALISGDPNQKLKIMALATTAVENQRAGKPLSPPEVAILSNLDPKDLEIINQNMTPDIRAILVKHQQGQPVSPEERKRVETAVLGTTEGVKGRPVAPAALPSTPVQAPEPPRATEAPTAPEQTVNAPQPPGLPPGAPPMEPPSPGEKGQVLIERPDGSMYWQNVDYVQSTDNVIYDPKKQAEMPNPLEGPLQAKAFSERPGGPMALSTFRSSEAPKDQEPFMMPRELPTLFGPRRESEPMTFDMPPTQPSSPMPTLFGPRRESEEIIYDYNSAPSLSLPESPMPTLFAPNFLREDEEEDWWA